MTSKMADQDGQGAGPAMAAARYEATATSGADSSANSMAPATTRTAGRRRLLGWAAVGATLKDAPMPGTANARATPSAVGSWLVSVPQPDGTVFVAAANCTADGGTITQFTSAQEELGASLGAGVWQATDDRTFVMSFRAPLYDPKTGVPMGMALVTGSFTLDTAGDAWSGPIKIALFAADGTLQSRTPEIPVSARRVTLER